MYVCARKSKNHKGIFDADNIHIRRLYDGVSRLKDNNTYSHIHKLDKYRHIMGIVERGEDLVKWSYFVILCAAAQFTFSMAYMYIYIYAPYRKNLKDINVSSEFLGNV